MSFVSHKRGGGYNREEDYYRELMSKGRQTVEQMARELSAAGYPGYDVVPAEGDMNSGNSNRVAANQLLVTAPAHVIFETDLDLDGVVERVEYRLNGTSLERSAVSKLGDGSVPPARYETVAVDVDNGALPLFTYPAESHEPLTVADRGLDENSVRILLLLRAPVNGKKQKQPYRTVGFEGIAQQRMPRGADLSADGGEATQQDLAPTDEPERVALRGDETFSEPVAVTYARKWTMR